MELKKMPNKDLEGKKWTFLQIGFIISLSLVLIAFEWSSTKISYDFLNMPEDDATATEIVPITVTKEKELKVEKPTIADIINITNDPDADNPSSNFASSEDPVLNLDSYYTTAVTEERDDILIHAEQMPKFPGGETALLRYLAQAVKYPEIARDNNIEGKVYVSFVVNKMGEVTRVKIIRGADPHLDREALRVINSMPLWEPGNQNNKPVSVSYTVPINFVLKK